MWMMRGRELNWAAMPLSGVFETTDGAVVMVGAFKENPLRDICQALGIDDLSADPRYATLEQQKIHRPELQAIFREGFATNTTAHWLARLDERGHPVRAGRDAGGCPGRPPDRLQPDDRGARSHRRRAGAPRGLAHRHVRRHRSRCAARRLRSASTMMRCWHRCVPASMRREHRFRRYADGIARVTLNRPERLNAIDSAAETALHDIWDAIDARPGDPLRRPHRHRAAPSAPART